jgi:hypothetical protein
LHRSSHKKSREGTSLTHTDKIMLNLPKRLTPPLPTYWQHPTLSLHRAWFSRRALQTKARAVLAGLVVLLLFVWALGASPWWLGLALLGGLFPSPKPQATLLEVEQQAGAAYTTALTAPQDPHGFKTRLEGMALAAQKNTDLPALPALEVLGMALLLSLLLVLPPRGGSLEATDPDQTINREALGRENPLPNGGNNNAEPVFDAPSRDAPPAGTDAKPGLAASGGSLAEENLGELKPGGGAAAEDPQALSREFMEALERGAVRDRDPNASGSKDGKVEDANPPQAGQQGSSGGDQDGQNGSGGQGQANRNNQQGQNGQNGNQSGSSNQNRQQGNGQGQNGDQQSGQSGSSGQNGQGQSGANQSGNGTTPNQNRDPRGNSLDRGENYEGFNPQNATGNNNRPSSTPGRGSRDAQGGAVPANRQNGQGKLEYLQGAPKGNQVRSGALQLPGDPKNGFTSPSGSAAYRRAAEAAVLDPRLPPEYQEMLKNYYR